MAKVFIDESTLANICDAIRGKEGTTESIPVINIANRISSLQVGSGKKFTTGTVTFATTAIKQTVTHNLDIIPSVFALYPTNLSDFADHGTDGAKGVIRGFVSVLIFDGFLCQVDNQGNTNTGSYSWAHVDGRYGGGISKITETTIELGSFGQNYKYQADKEYSWIAIE